MITREQIWDMLRDVMDPEIPTISLVDLGVITAVDVGAAGEVSVRMTPTFTGCPAMEYMRADVVRRLQLAGVDTVNVEVTFDEPWSTNRVTELGRAALLAHGIAPPEPFEGTLRLEVLNNTACPYCGSRDTTLSTPFGSTLCRSIHYCNGCRQAFEGFKPL